MSDSVLRIQGLTHSFNGVPAVDGVSLEIRRGEFVAIVGPSGCGKTTLLHLLCGHDEPTSGIVERNGAIRMVYQRDGLFPWATVAENIELGLRSVTDRAARRRQVLELVEFIRLGGFGSYYPHQLSGGMKQLVEVARAIAGDTQILLLDEPFSSLDYLTRLRMREELSRILAEKPRTVILVTHDIEEAAQLADRVIVFSPRPGRIHDELTVAVPRPRRPTDPSVVQTVQRALAAMGMENGNGGLAHNGLRG